MSRLFPSPSPADRPNRPSSSPAVDALPPTDLPSPSPDPLSPASSSPFSLRSHKLREAQLALSGQGAGDLFALSGAAQGRAYGAVSPQPHEAEGEALFGPSPGTGGWATAPSPPSLPAHSPAAPSPSSNAPRRDARSPPRTSSAGHALTSEQRARLRAKYGVGREEDEQLRRLLGVMYGRMGVPDGERRAAGELDRGGGGGDPPAQDGLGPTGILPPPSPRLPSLADVSLPDSPPSTTSSRRPYRLEQAATTIESVLAAGSPDFSALPEPRYVPPRSDGRPPRSTSMSVTNSDRFFTPEQGLPSSEYVSPGSRPQTRAASASPTKRFHAPSGSPEWLAHGDSPPFPTTTPLDTPPPGKTPVSPLSTRSSRHASLHLPSSPGFLYDPAAPSSSATSPVVSPPVSPPVERSLTPFPPPPFPLQSFPDGSVPRPVLYRTLGWDYLPSRSGVRYNAKGPIVDGELGAEEREWVERTRRVPNDGGLKDWWGNPVGERGAWGRAVLSPVLTETEPTHSSPSIAAVLSPTHSRYRFSSAAPLSPLSQRLAEVRRSLASRPVPVSAFSSSPTSATASSPRRREVGSSPLANGVVAHATSEEEDGLDALSTVASHREPTASTASARLGAVPGDFPSFQRSTATPLPLPTSHRDPRQAEPASPVADTARSSTPLAEARPRSRTSARSQLSPPRAPAHPATSPRPISTIGDGGSPLRFDRAGNIRSPPSIGGAGPQSSTTAADPPVSLRAQRAERIDTWARGVSGGEHDTPSWEGHVRRDEERLQTVEAALPEGVEAYSDAMGMGSPHDKERMARDAHGRGENAEAHRRSFSAARPRSTSVAPPLNDAAVSSMHAKRPPASGRSTDDVAAWARSASRTGPASDSPRSGSAASPILAGDASTSSRHRLGSAPPPASSERAVEQRRGPDFSGHGGQLSLDSLLTPSSPNRHGRRDNGREQLDRASESPHRPRPPSTARAYADDPLLGFADPADPLAYDAPSVGMRAPPDFDERVREASRSSSVYDAEQGSSFPGADSFPFPAASTSQPQYGRGPLVKPYRRGPYPVPQLSEEEKAARRALRKAGKSPEYELSPGETKSEVRRRAWKEQQAFEKEKTRLLRALDEAPGAQAAPIYNALAQLHLAAPVQASRELAVFYLQRSLDLDEAQPEMAHLLAVELEAQDLADAIFWHRIALQYGGDNPEYHLFLASALISAGDTDGACDAYTGLSRAFPDTPYEALALYRIGQAYHDYGVEKDLAAIAEAYHAALEVLQRLRLVEPAMRLGGRWDELDRIEGMVLTKLDELERWKSEGGQLDGRPYGRSPSPRLYYSGDAAVLQPSMSPDTDRTLDVILRSLRSISRSDGPANLASSTKQLADQVDDLYSTLKEKVHSDEAELRALDESLGELREELETLPDRLVATAKSISAPSASAARPTRTRDPLAETIAKLEQAKRAARR
ncbi:hypothetical protein JCM10207_002584 [Rhodosporidiobolus poonsookiae]